MIKNQHINKWKDQGKLLFQIPIMIDDVKDYKEFKMTRFTYFTIESDIPSPGWELHLKKMSIPFFLVGLSGIIYKPIGDNNIFNSPESIEKIFDTIEEHPSLYIDINDIWIPNFLLKGSKQRGQIYRVRDRVFNQAFLYRQQKISTENFLKSCRNFENDVIFSEIESFAFKKWSEMQISEAKKIYPKNPDIKLDWEKYKPGGTK